MPTELALALLLAGALQRLPEATGSPVTNLPKCLCTLAPRCDNSGSLSSRSPRGRLTVQDGERSRPAVGAQVWLVHWEGSVAHLAGATTDAGGYFRFEKVRRRRYYLYTCASDIASVEAEVTFDPKARNQELVLVTTNP